jgi:Flp pilus assembly protein TadG
MRKKRWKLVYGTEGSITPLMAVCGMVFIGMISMAIDMGHLYAVHNQLQNTADGAALAAAAKLISEDPDNPGVVTRNDVAAKEAALNVAGHQAVHAGLPEVADRDDIQIEFGVWNPKAANPGDAWSTRGESVPSNSDANAVQVTLRRVEGKTYGPVTNLLAHIFTDSLKTSEIKEVKAIAFMGFTNSVQTGMVTVPIALPDSLVSVAESEEGGNWLFRLLQPKEAVATSYVSTQFKDLGSNTFYQTNYAKPQIDTAKAYMFVINSSDSVPSTIVNNLNYAKTGTAGSSSKPIRPMERGTRLYPLSEYQWVSNIDSIFAAFKNAYNAKKDSDGKWKVVVPVYATAQPTAHDFRSKLFRLARIFSLGASEAQACFTFWNQSYPGGNVPLYIDKFATVNITGVETASTRTTTIPAPSGQCNDCTNSAIYDKKVNNQYIYSGSTTSARIADCMMKNPTDCRNRNYVTVEIPQGSSTTGLPPAQGGSTSTTVAASSSGSYSGRAVLVR